MVKPWEHDWERVGDTPEIALRTGVSRTGAWFQNKDEAQLAAAAPDLYRALRSMLTRHHCSDGDCPECIATEAALKKARGES